MKGKELIELLKKIEAEDKNILIEKDAGLASRRLWLHRIKSVSEDEYGNIIIEVTDL